MNDECGFSTKRNRGVGVLDMSSECGALLVSRRLVVVPSVLCSLPFLFLCRSHSFFFTEAI